METEKPDIGQVLSFYGADISHVPEGSSGRPVNCPFHDDESASASLSLDLQRFNCHVCTKFRGDSIQIIREAEGLGFRDALEWARDHLGYEGGSVRDAAPVTQY